MNRVESVNLAGRTHHIERAGAEALGVEAIFRPRHTDEHLRLLILTDRDHHSAADFELVDQRFGYLRSAGGNEYRVERCIYFPTVSAVVAAVRNISEPELH